MDSGCGGDRGSGGGGEVVIIVKVVMVMEMVMVLMMILVQIEKMRVGRAQDRGSICAPFLSFLHQCFLCLSHTCSKAGAWLGTPVPRPCQQRSSVAVLSSSVEDPCQGRPARLPGEAHGGWDRSWEGCWRDRSWEGCWRQVRVESPPQAKVQRWGRPGGWGQEWSAEGMAGVRREEGRAAKGCEVSACSSSGLEVGDMDMG